MKAKLPILLSLLISALAPMARAAGPVKVTKVAVVCEGKDEDTVGRTICFKLKEKIQASVGFRLIEQANAPGALTVHIIHVSTDPTLNTALSVTVTVGPLRMMVDQLANVWGSKRINDAADAILDDLDEDKEQL